jgi:hypothetical protein
MNIDEAEAADLPNLAKSTHYMRAFKYSKDLYMQVHAKAMTMYHQGEIPSETVEFLTSIYTEQGILTDSPFVQSRVQR